MGESADKFLSCEFRKDNHVVSNSVYMVTIEQLSIRFTREDKRDRRLFTPFGSIVLPIAVNGFHIGHYFVLG